MFDLTRLLNVLSSRAGTTADFQRMLDVEAAARQPRISGAGRRDLHQRGGDRRRAAILIVRSTA